jgi:sulfopyruvate decarboxylase subunit alpha
LNDEASKLLIEGFREAGIDFVSYMPDSVFYTFERIIEHEKSFTVIPVANESTGVAICCGAWLGGKKPVMLMESPGLLLTPYALARLPLLFGIPILLLVCHRGDMGDGVWWSTESYPAVKPLLAGLGVPYEEVDDPIKLKEMVVRAAASLKVSDRLRCILIRGRLLK